MKNSKTKTAVAEEPKQTHDNVFVFPTIRGRSRHREIHAFLSDLLDRHDETPAVAVASVAVREDGSVSISAKGVDADTADDLLAGARRLASRIEASKSHYPAARHQRGGISLLAISSTAFAIASYLNVAAWIDVLLVLGAQASAILLTAPPRR